MAPRKYRYGLPTDQTGRELCDFETGTRTWGRCPSIECTPCAGCGKARCEAHLEPAWWPGQNAPRVCKGAECRQDHWTYPAVPGPLPGHVEPLPAVRRDDFKSWPLSSLVRLPKRSRGPSLSLATRFPASLEALLARPEWRGATARRALHQFRCWTPAQWHNGVTRPGYWTDEGGITEAIEITHPSGAVMHLRIDAFSQPQEQEDAA
jgi:hypothetical protein